MSEPSKYQPIENYGVIGDLHTVALISLAGSIDFMSFTRFDSPTIFAALLDADKGGHFSITPQLENVSHKQLYLPDTAILITRFLADEGIAEITDFMPVNTKEYNCAIIRKVTTVRGKIKYTMNCRPRFGYASIAHHVERNDDGVTFIADDNSTKCKLLSSVPLEVVNNDVEVEFTLAENEAAAFVLESIPNESQRPSSLWQYIDESYRVTIAYWKDWIGKSHYRGRWIEIVNRSALTLKLLTSYTFGSMVAAPTFGLPETIGGERNWDYRYTWIRDAAFSMYVFLKLGFMSEASAFMNWLSNECLKNDLQLMYAVDGKTELDEHTLDYLEGFKGSKPVRIGNDAHKQLQLDIYGELIDTIYLYNKHGGPVTYDFWKRLERCIDFVVGNWRLPDHGIWEIRHGKKEFLYSKVMCWVAMDRAIKIAEDRSFPYPETEWRKVRDEIYEDIYYNFWNEDKQSFVQYRGSSALDATVLMMPMRQFISPAEKKWRLTLEAVEKELKTDVLIYRYRNNLEHIDGLTGIEGTFTMCSFWYVECLAKSGQVEKAREYFEKTLGYANHLGLFSEQLGLRGEHLGNFPQAFTHLALISAAIELNKDIEQPRFIHQQDK
jgi:GH15 family glucan-1,4-alpha-glucosidase